MQNGTSGARSQAQGLKTSRSVNLSKSLVLRVTTVMRCTRAVAPIRASRNGAGSGTWSWAARRANPLVDRKDPVSEGRGDARVEPQA